jgi:hypothetical protein
MHNARNRRASRQPDSKHQQAPPVARSARHEAEFMLRSMGTPPAFPRELIVPGPQRAITAPIAPPSAEIPALDLPASARPTAHAHGSKSPRRPKGKKARKAAMRMAAEQARKAAAPKAMPAAFEPAMIPAIPAALPRAEPAAVAEPAPRIIETTKIAETANAAMADAVSDALPAPMVSTVLEIAPETAPQALPEALRLPDAGPAPAPIFLLPSASEPLVTSGPPFAADTPLPRSRSLVPARRQGLVDVIAFLLRDSGRRLARWSARRHKMREQYAQVYASDLRKAALKSQQEALEALRQQQRR